MLHNRIFIQSRSWSILFLVITIRYLKYTDPINFDVHADRAHKGSCQQLAQTCWVLPMWCNPMVYFLYNGKSKLLYLLKLWKTTNFYKRIIILESSIFGLWWLMHYYLVVSLRLKALEAVLKVQPWLDIAIWKKNSIMKSFFACLHVYK